MIAVQHGNFPKWAVVALLAAAPTIPALGCAASDWEIGPIIRGKNYSVGMPLHPTPHGKGWSFEFPNPTASDGHVHYVTFAPGSLARKSKIIVRYRIDAAPGVRFVPQQYPDRSAMLTLYLQRKSDNWTAKGRYEFYRWFADPATMRALEPGVHELSVNLDDPNWGSVMSKKSGAYPLEYRAALADPDRAGLLFGSVGGRGHGVFATGPARFTLLSFRII